MKKELTVREFKRSLFCMEEVIILHGRSLFCMEIISSTNGFDKLCLDGQMYVRKIGKNGWIRWECCMRRREVCTQAMTTDDA